MLATRPGLRAFSAQAQKVSFKAQVNTAGLMLATGAASVAHLILTCWSAGGEHMHVPLARAAGVKSHKAGADRRTMVVKAWRAVRLDTSRWRTSDATWTISCRRITIRGGFCKLRLAAHFFPVQIIAGACSVPGRLPASYLAVMRETLHRGRSQHTRGSSCHELQRHPPAPHSVVQSRGAAAAACCTGANLDCLPRRRHWQAATRACRRQLMLGFAPQIRSAPLLGKRSNAWN